MSERCVGLDLHVSSVCMSLPLHFHNTVPHPTTSIKKIGKSPVFYASGADRDCRDRTSLYSPLLPLELCRSFLQKRDDRFFMVLCFKQVVETKSFGLHRRIKIVFRSLL